ncbi:Fe-S cluster assembly protein SufD [Hoeflea sp. WL0058]|uniref:Fe-S cluster assembly protein SufD n=1 Tax=Flavimaribacter sediminis TaxID=2865987 RepID=A0AAE3CZW7_9HYPH|nr:Fe-S cluster assembly protein SufD [Flavimaribacter sediminis]MBW8637089.1 Fe-S cluster assembly protein SufD [Flavimaribacter sediminis]
MNVQSKKPITAAEQSLLDRYSERRDALQGDASVTELRDGLVHDFAQTGLPGRRIETWHYTDLRTLLKSAPSDFSAEAGASAKPIVPDSIVLSARNDCQDSAIPDGMDVSSFKELLASERATDLLASKRSDDFIGRVNSMFVDGGSVVEVSKGAKLEKTIEFQNASLGGHLHTRMSVNIGEGASGTFIERQIAAGKTDSFVSSITDLTIGKGAAVTWIISQERGVSDTHLGQINIRLGEDARLTLFIANAGGHLVRQEVHVTADGENSDFALRGVNLLGGDSHTDITMEFDHLVANCVSAETLRNVVFDRARGVFQGQIRVAQIAQKTDAKMACNTLLLSDEGEFFSKPELEIFADDVQCGHGATVTDIDENHLFYLKARGISDSKARAMLVNAFISEIVEDLEQEDLVEAFENRFSEWLAQHA